jgi:hypothetical protein
MPGYRDPQAFTDEQIAEVVHELNSAFKRLAGEPDFPPWRELPDDAWQKADCLRQVRMLRSNARLTAEEDHVAWMRERREKGWKFGERRDEAARLNPLLVPWEELPFPFRARSAAGFEVIRIMLGRSRGSARSPG